MSVLRKIGFGLLIIGMVAAGCARTAEPDPNAPKPSKPGEAGKAVFMKGNAANGEKVYINSCSECHGEQGMGGVENGGAEEATIPALKPVDPMLYNSDSAVFAANLDLFIEHGSVPAGKPTRIMMGFGDLGLLKPQEIADVIAYIIQLNDQQLDETGEG